MDADFVRERRDISVVSFRPVVRDSVYQAKRSKICESELLIV